jgi:hypothetical protein
MKKLFALLLAIGMLVGCSETVVEEEPEKEVKEEVVKEEPKPEPEPEPVVVEEPEVTMDEYAGIMSVHLDNFALVMGEFSDLMFQGTNPDVFVSTEYHMQVQVVANELIMVIADIESVEVPAEAQHIHDMTMRAMDEYRYVAENIVPAIQDVDVANIGLLTDRLVVGNEYLNEATMMVLEEL